MGGPITLNVTNLDHQKWPEIMDEEMKNLRRSPNHVGHADLVRGIKYRFDDLHNSTERSSARETTIRISSRWRSC